jgi:Cdc6-like AAA superfamily ATPase
LIIEKDNKMMKFSTRENPLSSEIAPMDSQVVKSDDPLPLGNVIYILCGKRGSGKSTLALNLLKRKTSPYYRQYDNIFLISPTAGRDEKFSKLIEELSIDGKFYDTLDDEIINEIVERLQKFNDQYKEEHPKKEPRNLLILDDCIHLLPASNQKSNVNQIMSNGRHLKLSTWIMTQQLTKLNRLIRTNCDLLSYFPNDSKKEFETIESEWAIEPKLLKAVYDYATSSPNSFLHISFFGRKPTFYKKFDRILIE